MTVCMTRGIHWKTLAVIIMIAFMSVTTLPTIEAKQGGRIGGGALFPLGATVLVGAGLGAVAGVCGASLIRKIVSKIKLPKLSGKTIGGTVEGESARSSFMDADEKTNTDVSKTAKEQYEAAHRRYLVMLESGKSPGDPDVIKVYEEYKYWYDRHQQSK